MIRPPSDAAQAVARAGWHETDRGPDSQCTPWCVDHDHVSHDPACWGADRCVNLTLEEGYPHGALAGMAHWFDPPRIGANAFRQEPGWQSCVYLHLYRPSENEHIDLDQNLQLAAMLLAVAEEIDR
ncbi:hypothetical protein AWC11_22010 [Mycobacterium interjectum]|nr:hypothetical protein AWC11_22010 [Mycobacterium interjectum]